MNHDFIVTAKDGYPLAAIKYSAKNPKQTLFLRVQQGYHKRFIDVSPNM